MQEQNAPLEAPVQQFLEGLMDNPHDHARFLNMLSMLEHMGSRKIMISQMNKTLTEDTLKHLAEEARHAFFFKRQAEKIAKKALDGYEEHNTMQRTSAQLYFGRLDAGIAKIMKNKGYTIDPYYWVSLIIELRACWIYQIYQNVLEQSTIKISLKSLLAEEDMHLQEMYEECGADTTLLESLCRYETELFEKFWTGMLKVENYPQAA